MWPINRRFSLSGAELSSRTRRCRERTVPSILFATLCLSCGGEAQLRDPIDGIPAAQQRVIWRKDLDWRWPLTVGTGTLGCATGAVVLRAAGVSYAVNDEARARGFASIEPLRATAASAPPRNPLPGVRQDARMQIFAEARACDRPSPSGSVAAHACRQRIRERHRLSESELQQIEAEGEERVWPPLVRGKVSLDRLTQEGLKLCSP